MKRIDNVLMVGLGAIGGAYALKLHKAESVNLRVLAKGQRKHRYQTDGFLINGQRIDFEYADPDSPAPVPADLILVAVKDYGLGQAIQDMKPFVGQKTLLLSLMNGITSEERLADAFGWDQVLYGLCMGIDGFRKGNEIRFHQYGTISFGRGDNGKKDPAVTAVATLFDEVSIDYQIPENMIYELWYKFMVNVGINQAAAVVGAGFGAFQQIPEAHALMQSAMWELIRITEKNGINLTSEDLKKWDGVLYNMPPGSRPSMLNDLENHRPTEVDMLAGVIMELGRQYGVPTPVNEALYRAIRAKEIMCSGKIQA